MQEVLFSLLKPPQFKKTPPAKNQILEEARESQENREKNPKRWKLLVRPNALVACYSSNKRLDNWRKKPEKSNVIKGTLSPNAARKIKQAIRWLVASSTVKEVYEKKQKRKVKWKINFATLTFHENFQDDNAARSMLSRWLEVAKYRWNLTNYIWKAEPQERGAIHFHLCTNVYIPHAELKYTWNRELRKEGLNAITDNSTDIHADTNIRSTEAYLTNYLLNEEKHKGRRKIKGRLWSCSHALSKAGKEYLLIGKDELQSISEELSAYSLEKIIRETGRVIPTFLTYNGYWILPNNYYQNLNPCALKKQFETEIQLLQNKQIQRTFWPLEL